MCRSEIKWIVSQDGSTTEVAHANPRRDEDDEELRSILSEEDGAELALYYAYELNNVPRRHTVNRQVIRQQQIARDVREEVRRSGETVNEVAYYSAA